MYILQVAVSVLKKTPETTLPGGLNWAAHKQKGFLRRDEAKEWWDGRMLKPVQDEQSKEWKMSQITVGGALSTADRENMQKFLREIGEKLYAQFQKLPTDFQAKLAASRKSKKLTRKEE